MRYKHDMPDATKNDVEVMKKNSDKPVRASNDAEEILQKAESEELVEIADNAIVFRRDIIVTNPEIQERIADQLIERMGAGGF